MNFFCHVVGLSCEGFEEQVLALFTAIEANRNESSMLALLIYPLRHIRGKRESKRLACSINYDVK